MKLSWWRFETNKIKRYQERCGLYCWTLNCWPPWGNPDLWKECWQFFRFIHPCFQKNLFLKIFQTWFNVYFPFEIFTVAKQYNHHHLRLQNGLLVSIVNPLSTFQWFHQWTQNLVWPVCIYFHFIKWVYTSDCSQQQWLNRLFCEYQNSTILICPIFPYSMSHPHGHNCRIFSCLLSHPHL